MTYYLVGNNVENQLAISNKNEKSLGRNIPSKTHFNIRSNSELRERNRPQTYASKNEKFLPSVQYDPKDVGPNNAYFTPLRYGMKLNQKDYSSFTTYQNARPVYFRPTVKNIVPEKQFFATETPRKLQNPPKRDYLPLKQVIKTIPSTVQDYFLDYESQLAGKQQSTSYDYEQPFDEFESFRFATPAPDKMEQVKVFKSSISRPDINNQALKVPVSELDHIVKTLQLSNQLPEMLNKDNIDSSIRTLVEILNILHNSRSQQPQEQQHPIPNPVKLKSKPPDYGFHEDFSRPDLLETNYYVTPNVIDRPEINFKSKPILKNHHNDINLKNENVIQYYVPNEQEVNIGYKETFSQAVNQQDINESDNHSYKSNLHSGNTLKNEKFKYPISTERPTNTYTIPNYVPKHSQNIPLSLKYGATRGKPHVDYPAYSTIPPTNFNCKQQRYKGFFGDPATRCQVKF